MRALLAAALALNVALAAAGPHLHLGEHGPEECAACVSRGGEVAESQTPDVAPAAVQTGEAVLAPGPAPVTGAPLGAIPGQSPPSATR